MKSCPFCAEEIQDAAIVCKHCGRELSASIPAAPPKTKSKAPVIAIAVIGAVLLIGFIGNVVTNPSGRATAAPPLKFFVTVQLDGIQVTNEDDIEWEPCTLAIEGGYEGDIKILKARQTLKVPFSEMSRDGNRVPTGEGYVRGRKRVDISCSAPNGYRSRATYGATK